MQFSHWCRFIFLHITLSITSINYHNILLSLNTSADDTKIKCLFSTLACTFIMSHEADNTFFSKYGYNVTSDLVYPAYNSFLPLSHRFIFYHHSNNFGDWNYGSSVTSTLVSLGSSWWQRWCRHHHHCHHQHHSCHIAALSTKHHSPHMACAGTDSLVGLVTCKQGCIHWLHAWWTCEASHEPVINTYHVISVHARQVTYCITNHEFDHTDHTSGNKNAVRNKHQE